MKTMKIVMKKTLLLCLGLLLAAGANAQNRTVELTLDKALEIALDENPTIKVAGLEIERQRYVRQETVGNFLPTLSADGTYTRAIEQSTMGGLPLGSDNTLNLAGNISLPLFVPALFKTLKLNDEQMRAAVESARASKLNLVNEVRKAYYQILLAEQSLEVLHSSARTIGETVKDTRSKLENELASEYDLITAEVQLSNLQPTIYEAEKGIKTAKQMMKMLLDLPEDVDITIAETLTGIASAAPANSFSRDVSGNTDLRSLEIQSDILKRQLQLSRTSRMPTLVAFGNITYMGQDQISNFGEVMAGVAGPKTEFKWQHPINVGARISVPIFAGRTNVLKEKQLKNTMKQMEHQQYYLEQGLNVQVENAINAISTARAKMDANNLTIAQAQKGYDISKVRYDAGMGTILELNSAELALTQAKLNYTQAIYDYLSAQADYEKVIGKEN